MRAAKTIKFQLIEANCSDHPYQMVVELTKGLCLMEMRIILI
jgi:hypothetical protein